MSTQITFAQIHPFVRYAREVTLSELKIHALSKAYDHRLFYVLNGSGRLKLGNTVHNLLLGDVTLIPPGTSYQLLPDSDNPMRIIGINFDFISHTNHIIQPQPPSPADIFDDSCIINPVTFLDFDAFEQVIYLSNINTLEPALLAIKHEFDMRRRFFAQSASGLFLTVITEIARAITSVNTVNPMSEKHTVTADTILAFIHDNYQKELSNSLIGDTFHFHPNYVNRLISAHTGLSLHQYLLSYRISRAMLLIQTTNLSLTQIAAEVGFRDLKHFSKAFKKKTGKPPRAYRLV